MTPIFNVGDTVIHTSALDYKKTEHTIVQVVTDRGNQPLYKLSGKPGILWTKDSLTLVKSAE